MSLVPSNSKNNSNTILTSSNSNNNNSTILTSSGSIGSASTVKHRSNVSRKVNSHRVLSSTLPASLSLSSQSYTSSNRNIPLQQHEPKLFTASQNHVASYLGVRDPHEKNAPTKNEKSQTGPAKNLLPKPQKPTKCHLFCVFYVEFDNIVGPKVCFQSPEKFMDRDIGICTEEVEQCLKEAFDKVQPSPVSTKLNSSGVKNAEDDWSNLETGKGNPTHTSEAFNDNNNVMISEDKKKVGNFEDVKNEGKVPCTNPVLPDNGKEAQTSPLISKSIPHISIPQNSLSIFDSTSEYIIPSSELLLSDRIIFLSTHNLHIIACPTIISSTQYDRNNLIFSVGLVIRRTEDPYPFLPVLSKLSQTLRSMETESSFLTAKATRQRIQGIMEGILISLNGKKRGCNLILDTANVLHLKLFRTPKAIAAPVPDHVVPVLLKPQWQVQLFEWDLTINWILPHIDGIRHVQQIAQSSDVDLGMVRACLRVLVHHGMLGLVDVFRYGNRYECTSLVAEMLSGQQENLLKHAVEFVSKHHHGTKGSPNQSILDSNRHSRKEASSPDRAEYLPHEGHERSPRPRSINEKIASPNAKELFLRNSPPEEFPLASSYPPRSKAYIPNPTENSPVTQNSSEYSYQFLNSRQRKIQRQLKDALVLLYSDFARNKTFGEILMCKVIETTSDKEATKEILHEKNSSKIHKKPQNELKSEFKFDASTKPMRAFQTTGTRHKLPVPIFQNISEQNKSLAGTTRQGLCANLNESRKPSISRGKYPLKKEKISSEIDWKAIITSFDHRRFITFGLIFGLIQRVHEYPFSYDIDLYGRDESMEDKTTPRTVSSVSSCDSITACNDSKKTSPIHNFKALTHHQSFGPNHQDSDSLTSVATTSKNISSPPSPCPVIDDRKGSNRMRIGPKLCILNKPEKLRILALQISCSMDGTKCDDELSCLYQKTLKQLIELVKAHAHKEIMITLSKSDKI